LDLGLATGKKMQSVSLEDKVTFFNNQADIWLEQTIKNLPVDLQNFREAFVYSMHLPGKRFRPLLALSLAESYGVGPQRVFPWALTIELVHTYSLIHDDLPAMDNSDSRRGKPSHHVVFGEGISLLVGDGFLTEAFGLISSRFRAEPELAVELTDLLVRSIGVQGMVGGQYLDLLGQKIPLSAQEIELMLKLKTGALISCTLYGTGLICGLPKSKMTSLKQFGDELGLAFQIKDDLLDENQFAHPERNSILAVLGKQGSEARLAELTASMNAHLSELGLTQSSLAELVRLNLNRSF
jgi:geranylgeranyl diphosphate synthase type II